MSTDLAFEFLLEWQRFFPLCFCFPVPEETLVKSEALVLQVLPVVQCLIVRSRSAMASTQADEAMASAEVVGASPMSKAVRECLGQGGCTCLLDVTAFMGSFSKLSSKALTNSSIAEDLLVAISFLNHLIRSLGCWK